MGSLRPERDDQIAERDNRGAPCRSGGVRQWCCTWVVQTVAFSGYPSSQHQSTYSHDHHLVLGPHRVLIAREPNRTTAHQRNVAPIQASQTYRKTHLKSPTPEKTSSASQRKLGASWSPPASARQDLAVPRHTRKTTRGSRVPQCATALYRDWALRSYFCLLQVCGIASCAAAGGRNLCVHNTV